MTVAAAVRKTSLPHVPVGAQKTTGNRIRLALSALLLFVSGGAALVYQVLWIKQLSLVVGVEVHAVSIAVSAFFAGLAAGGWWLGRQADRLAHPLRLCAGLEVGIAVLAVGTTFLLSHAAPAFVALQASVGPLAWGLPLFLVAVPAFLMGGTLPVLLRAAHPGEGRVATEGGRLYAANTAGAIAGVLLAAFILIPALGVRGAAFAAALANIAVAVVAFLMDRQQPSLPAIAIAPNAVAAPAGSRAALLVYAVAGGLALGYEVVWSQAIVQFMSTRAYAFAIVLATYLAGLVIGSALASRHADRTRHPWGMFGVLIAAAGMVALFEFVVLGAWLPEWQALAAQAVAGPNPMVWMSARFLVAALCIVFVPTLLLGAAFPYALRLAVGPGNVGAGVGRVVAVNTVGGIVGSLLVGFLLVPALGLVQTLAVLAVAAAALGAMAAWRAQGRWRLAAPVLLAVTVVGAVSAEPDRLSTLLAQARGGKLVAYEESRGGTVAVIGQDSGSRHLRRLYIQGVSNSGDTMTSRRYMRLQALLPLIIHSNAPKSALVIGLGTGITGGALLTWPSLERREVVELLPAVVRAAPNFSGNYGLTTDSRMTIRVRDGRHELLGNPQRHDLITLEPPPPSAAGVVNLYATEFYKLAASRLQPGGMVAQWLPLPTQNDADTRALVQSFLAVFPHATLWTTELHEMMLVGSMEPIELDLPRIRERMAQPEVAKALAEVGVASPEALLATWVADREGLVRYAGDVRAVTDDWPAIEYAPWVRREEFPMTLSNLIELQTEPPLRGADEATIKAIKAERATLMGFYRAGLASYIGNRANWAREMNAVMRADGTNPYYLWFGGQSR